MSPDCKIWLRHAIEKLNLFGITEAEREIVLIWAHLLSRNPGEAQAAMMNNAIESDMLARADNIIDERCRIRKPLAYILGKWEFFGLQFAINEHVLVPRPETELLVQTALDALPDEEMLGIDIGTGCGAIAVALLAHRKNWRIIGTDICHAALEVAQRNAALNYVADRFIPLCCDMLSAIESADFIISNPPYIPSAEIATLAPEVQHEPRHALDGGDDGLDAIRNLLGDAMRLMPRLIAFEFGYGQDKAIGKMLSDKKLEFSIINDLAKIPRIALIYAHRISCFSAEGRNENRIRRGPRGL